MVYDPKFVVRVVLKVVWQLAFRFRYKYAVTRRIAVILGSDGPGARRKRRWFPTYEVGRVRIIYWVAVRELKLRTL